MQKRNPVQLELKPKYRHGGARPGAGRPKIKGACSHVARPQLKSRYPIHVTLKIASGVPNLRRKSLLPCLKAAIAQARTRDLRIAHFAVLSNHLHLILETSDKESLSLALQSLGVSLAKRVNAVLSRKGPVLARRYHAHVLKTPTEVRNALKYVLTNESKHDAADEVPADWVRMGEASSALVFREWRALFARVPVRVERRGEDLETTKKWLEETLTLPKTWLLAEGWKKGRREATRPSPRLKTPSRDRPKSR